MRIRPRFHSIWPSMSLEAAGVALLATLLLWMTLVIGAFRTSERTAAGLDPGGARSFLLDIADAHRREPELRDRLLRGFDRHLRGYDLGEAPDDANERLGVQLFEEGILRFSSPGLPAELGTTPQAMDERV